MIIQNSLSDGLQLSITKSCQALEVSCSGYYKWVIQQQPVHSSKNDDMDLKDEIQESILEFPGYGYRRVTAELRNQGYAVNHKRVLKLMREDNLLHLKK
jgi:putative transposase